MTAKAKKAKPMSAKEKREREIVRKQLRAKGIIPPKKKPLNRETFCNEADELVRNADFALYPYLCWALLEMLGAGGHINHRARSPEAVGVARAVKLAVRRSEYEQAHAGEKITVKDMYEATKDIFNA
ncbi:MAG: hypothetical protein PHY12_05790 [Eubacteriales bacterium]|nr:hypothetical protein [Eubacteriales bacterium]